MKYYYDDPIKAAWMMKEHGIICVGEQGHEHWPLSDTLYFASNLYMEDQNPGAPVQHEVFYIHPDCHELLKPRVGDLCSFENWSNAGSDKPNIAYGPYYEEAWDNVGLEIIQRDNKAWFNPEVEA